MLGILIVVVILGVLAAIALSQLEHTTTTHAAAKTDASLKRSTGASSTNQQAAIAACQADFQIVQQLLQLYQTEHQANPPAGTAWALSLASEGEPGDAWPSSPSFSISWDGSVLSVVPTTGAASHGSSGTVSPPTGCFAA
jgi:hypothetical protein